MKHTPTPWVVIASRIVDKKEKVDEIAYMIVTGDFKETECNMQNGVALMGGRHGKEDAALIVRAVNSFDGLLAAAKQYRTVLVEKSMHLSLRKLDEIIADAEAKRS